MLNYEDMVLLRTTRQHETQQSCNCYICITGRYKGHPKKQPDQIEKIGKKIGMHAASKDNDLPKWRHKPKKKECITSCKTCKQYIGCGIPHKCTLASSSKNIIEQVGDLPSRQREQIVTGLLKEISMEEKSKSGQSNNLYLSTKGTKQSVTLKPILPSQTFSNGDVDALQERINASNTKIETISALIRSNLHF